jgi:hypothetical protein
MTTRKNSSTQNEKCLAQLGCSLLFDLSWWRLWWALIRQITHVRATGRLIYNVDF